MRFLIIITFTLTVISSCKSNSPGNIEFANKKELIIGDTSDGWGADVKWSIIKTETLKNGRKLLTTLSTYKGSDVGFILELSPESDTSEFKQSGLTIKSSGATSNEFLKTLSSLYQLGHKPGAKFVDSFSTPFVDINLFSKKVARSEKARLDSTKTVMTKPVYWRSR